MTQSETVTKDRKTLILDTAKDLFAEKGYSGTSMRDLAQRVGVEPPSIYFHFTSKEAILWQICLEKVQYFQQVMRSLEGSNDDAEQMMQQLVDAHINIALNDPDGHRVFLNEWRNLSDLNLRLFLRERQQYEYKCILILRLGMESGIFRKMDPKVAFYTILNALRWVYRYKWEKGDLEREEVINEIKQLVFHGLITK